MIYRTRHQTLFSYTHSVPLTHNRAYLTPLTLPEQILRANTIEIVPKPDRIQHTIDYYGNRITYFTVESKHIELSVTSCSEVEVNPRIVPDPPATPFWLHVRDALAAQKTPEDLAAAEFTLASPYIKVTDAVAEFARQSITPEKTILGAALDLTWRIHAEFEYVPNSTGLETSVDEVLADRKGVCQDFSHLAIACMRAMGLAARYVSGFMRTLPAPGQEKLLGADETHAWFSVYVPHHGWIDLDPTNNILCGIDHITVAIGRDYGDISPVRGVVTGGGTQKVQVSVDVEVIDDPGDLFQQQNPGGCEI
jgi:transglutaminase-like putative cysteine protease